MPNKETIPSVPDWYLEGSGSIPMPDGSGVQKKEPPISAITETKRVVEEEDHSDEIRRETVERINNPIKSEKKEPTLESVLKMQAELDNWQRSTGSIPQTTVFIPERVITWAQKKLFGIPSTSANLTSKTNGFFGKKRRKPF